ncbi:MAG: ArnT family glycosyltransferase [Polaromonas sp.]|jgi:4-amino-4-deoxy-L-arabinose transferase-like glycosyltransferase
MIVTHNTSSRWLWWVLGSVALLRLLTLGLYPLTDTTEARYAEVARKMAELGNWVTPLYDYGVPFWAKPPLTTWLSAISIQLLGVNEFAARLPYFLLAVLIAWLLWAWVRRSSARQAQLAVAIMSGTLLYVIASAAVMTDLGLLLGTTLAMRGFWAAFEPRESGRPKEGWLLFIGLGIGLLAKGPIAVVLSGLPIGLWMLLTGNIKTSWQRLPWVKGSLLTLAIAAPWYVMAEIRTPGFWEYFFIGEHWNRFTVTGWAGDKYGTAHATQRGAIWLFALAAVMPWTALLPMLWIGRKAAPVLQSPKPSAYCRHFTFYLLAWSVGPCLFFTMSGNILWTYVLPALPAMALLAARWLSSDTRTRWVHGVVGAGVLVMACLVAAFFGREQLNDSWKSAKTVVLAYQAKGAGQPLLFMGDLPYSASYYAQGKVKALQGNAELAARLASSPVFVALNPDQVKALPPELAARLRLEATSGAYRLYSSSAK